VTSPFKLKGRRTLFAKYVTSFVGLIVFVLALIGITEVWIAYRDAKQTSLHEAAATADAAALKAEQFLQELGRQISWATRASSNTIEQRRADDQLILDHTPAIAEIAEIDNSGRVVFDLARNGTPAMREADFAYASRKALIDKPQYGPVRFGPRGPLMQLFISHANNRGGVTIIDLELRYLSDIVNGTQSDPGVYAYIVTDRGRLIVHSDANQAKHTLDLSSLPQIAALISTPDKPLDFGQNVLGQSVLTASAVIPDVNWYVVVEQPFMQALKPVFSLLWRLFWLFGLSLCLCFAAAVILARRMLEPIKAFESGAARLAAGNFSHPIHVETGDEIEALSHSFNRMATRVHESYEKFEQEVRDRTGKLAQSVRELQALEEVGRSVASSLDLGNVLANIVQRAAELAQAEGGAIYSFDRDLRSFKLAEAHGLDPGFVQAIRSLRLNRIDGLLLDIAAHKKPIQIPEIVDALDFPLRAATLAAGFRSALIVPLVGAEDVWGVLIVERRATGRFPADTVALMQSFATQCVLAMKNAHLFREVEEKGRQLAIASEHKSMFFANMSHELRTPLNAVLGYAELLLDGLYGELPERAVPIITRMQASGTHLLGLINDILDLSKMEAGEMSLSLDSYSMRNVIESVIATTGSLAHAKDLKVTQDIKDTLPAGFGDERRLTQVLLNIVSNAIKFTEQGGVTIRARVVEDDFEVCVEDTGLGIAPEDIDRIFEAFQQADNTSTRVKGGTGLGLSISKRFIDMHGGTISVSSTPGQGSTFQIFLPIRAEVDRRAA